MEKSKLKIYLLIAVFSLITSGAFSQSKSSLQRDYARLQAEIRELQNEIARKNKDQKISIQELNMINAKIKKRSDLINNIQYQLMGIDKEIGIRKRDVDGMQGEINLIKKEYADMVRWLSKNHNEVSKLAFVMEASNFKDAYTRLNYIRKYGDYRTRQSKILRNQIDRIMGKITALNTVKETKKTLLLTSKEEQDKLLSEKKHRDQIVSEINGQLTSLKAMVKDKNKQAAQVNKRIKSVIEDEIRKERERMLAKVKKADPAVTTLSKADIEKTPEGRLSSSFQSSKGSLPWPVSNGNVTSFFGTQPHPSDPSIFIQNNGIDIKTPSNASIKAIYSGKVVRIFSMPGYNTCVMVKHGDFFTVYSYLSKASVYEGQEVKANETIGVSGYDQDHGFSLVNLQIWHYQDKQNPLNWLSSR